MFTTPSVDLLCGLVLQGSANLVHDATSWQCEHEWRQDIAVVTKWLAGASPVCNLNFTRLTFYHLHDVFVPSRFR